MQMFKKKPEPSPATPTARARKRAASLDSVDLELAMDTILSTSLPEVFTQWRQGHDPPKEVVSNFQAAIAIWDELERRNTPTGDW